MTLQLTFGVGYFQINDMIYPRGKYRIVDHGDRIGLRELNGLSVVYPTLFGTWVNGTSTPYPTKQALIDDLRLAIYL